MVGKNESEVVRTESYVLATTQVDNNLPLGSLLRQKPRHRMLYRLHPQPIPSIDER